MKTLLLAMTMVFTMSHAFANEAEVEDLNPYDPNISEILEELDSEFQETAEPMDEIQQTLMDMLSMQASCYQRTCAAFIDVNKAKQTADIFENGVLVKTVKVSTGTAGHPTPNFDRHPDGRIFDKYSSSKYPGGDYNGLGNMPYAVFIKGGFALHGTPRGNWKKLGTRASHGCIRMHPDNGRLFNRLVRKYGRLQTWITVR